MNVSRATIDIFCNKVHSQYFRRDVPMMIHQIWFGDDKLLNKERIELWKEYSRQTRFCYRLWTLEDLDSFKVFMLPENFSLMKKMLALKNYWAASDIARYEILKEDGGIYIDVDFLPPTLDGNYISLNSICYMKGLNLMIEHHSRNIGEGGIFVANGFIFSSPNHPVIVSAVEQINKNVMTWFKKTGNYDAMFCTGPFFFNKVLWGYYGVVPIKYLKEYNMIN